MSDQTEDVSRRDLLRHIGATIALTTFGVNVVTAEAAQHVHKAVSDVKKTGDYKPKCFTASEYKTLQRLADMIIPADERSPGPLAAGAPGCIDFLSSQCKELAEIYARGFAKLHHQMHQL